MRKTEIDDLKTRVSCASVLEDAWFSVDVRESTRKAIKYRREAEIVIVIHEGRGWFDPLSDAKGDVLSLVEHLHGIGFSEGMERVMRLVGYVPQEPEWTRLPRKRDPDQSIPERWRARRRPWPGSMTWRYLSEVRFLPEELIRAAIQQDVLREGPKGSVWAAHTDDQDKVVGWEERGLEWRCFASGGAKVLFRFGEPRALRFCITEAAIDAMSLAAIEESRPDSAYFSTGGGWAPSTDAAIRALAAHERAQLIAATDNNDQGECFAQRLKAIADEAACGFERLRPAENDWNEELKAMKIKERKGTKKPPAA